MIRVSVDLVDVRFTTVRLTMDGPLAISTGCVVALLFVNLHVTISISVVLFLFVLSRASRRVVVIGVVLGCLMTVLLAFAAVPAVALRGSPQWTVTSVSRPTNFAPPGSQGYTGDDAYVVTVTNTGSAPSDGTPIVITDELPEGLSAGATEASGEDQLAAFHLERARLTCLFQSCTYAGVVQPDDTLTLRFPVAVTSASPPVSCGKDVPASAISCVTNVVRVSGGGAPDAAMETETTISSVKAAFGIAAGGATMALSTTQAGAHPDLTTSIAFNTSNAEGSLAGDFKDTIDEEPRGFALDLIDTPSCPAAEFHGGECPIGTQVGFLTLAAAGVNGSKPVILPVYNLTPDPGEVAKIGFVVAGQFVYEGAVLLRPTDYGGTVIFSNANQSQVEIDNVVLTVWGVPADPIHDQERFKGDELTPFTGSFGIPSDAARAPFVTNPTLCGEPMEAVVRVNSWEQPGKYVQVGMPFDAVTGCDRLTMEPSLTVEPTSVEAYAPTGLDLGMTIPQTYDNALGLATSTLKRAVVALPEGMTVNPSAGAGLGECSEAQYAEEAAQFVAGRGCPSESKLGEVSIVSPAIKEQIGGSVYLASPAPHGESGRNPFKSLLALYIVARLADRGIIVKAAGEVTADPFTGQLVTTFDDLPPLPFGTFTFRFHSGAAAPLVTPSACGDYVVKVQLTPWSDPVGAPLTPLIPPFPIMRGSGSGPCPQGGVPPFAPQVLAGTQDNVAGSYSPIYVRVIRGDGEQEVTRFSSQLPPGLTANLSGVPFCTDGDIELANGKTGAQEESEPSCPAASRIGHTLVGAGVGSALAQAPGKVYMAGPYHGAPFSIVAITSAKVGPFDLGTVVVREALRIDPNTAAVTADASASDPIPHIIKGIVVHVRDIRVYLDRSNFTLNPTNCERMTFSATVDGSGADYTNPADQVPVTVDDPFQAADCASLKFKPIFKVSTSGKTSRSNGASLTVKLSYPNAPQGSQANIRSVKVNLPRQLPSELRTLQKACPDVTFNVNPAACPASSRVGQAKAITPILPVPLIGPAYFVSHGGAKFPELIIVLQGYGVMIDLRGETFISKHGITSSTFRAVPDQPVASFELTLPQGPYSALAANGNLCKAKLAMPTAFTAQNGLVIRQSTKIIVTGCPKAKKKVKKASHKRGRGKGTQRKKR